MHLHQPTLSVDDRLAAGRRLREHLPRAAHATWKPRSDRRDPIDTLRRVDEGRVASLLPEKYRRMRQSPFAFFRGAAAVMASDLASLPNTGLLVQICGDAHVRNLGAYAAPDGRLVFDLNDFDETIRAPWEWDVKRLATSLVLSASESGQPTAVQREAVRTFVASYRMHMRECACMPLIDMARHLVTRRLADAQLDLVFRQAARLTPLRNLERLVVHRGGRYRFHDRRPLLEHVTDRVAAGVVRALQTYRETLSVHARVLFDGFQPADVAFKVVGTGSVGTRDYVVLLFGRDARDPLFLQVKEAVPSCYADYVSGAPRVTHQGRRVAEGQQMLQTTSDPFLGYTRFDGHDYLVRQLADHKAALEPTALKGGRLLAYAQLCGEVLAKGHARTGDAGMIAGYVGSRTTLDKAVTAFAFDYAKQTDADFVRFTAWLRSGRRRTSRRRTAAS